MKYKYFAFIATKYSLAYNYILVRYIVYTWGWPTLAETCSDIKMQLYAREYLVAIEAKYLYFISDI
jgi:hypothetical protein